MPSKSSIRRQSAVLLVYVNQLPRWVPLVLLPALLVAGLALPGAFGAVALVLLALVVWFLFMASPTRNPAHRVIRLAVPLVLLAFAIGKLVS
ncbi:DUF6703 family protein [Actinoallomurus acaciae]|uniref:DUF6703 family protein n=1 Tax=Actinoallomurus acaciae TaxID=502577 RepID=A0ABV5YTV8_9ACTN